MNEKFENQPETLKHKASDATFNKQGCAVGEIGNKFWCTLCT